MHNQTKLQHFTLLFLFLIFTFSLHSQYTLSGTVTNTSLQPVRYVSVSIKELQLNTQTNAEGKFNFKVEEGRYNLILNMVGYKPQLITLVVNAKDVTQNIILEENKVAGELAQVYAIRKDRWKEIMQNVIRNKENYLQATSTFTCNVYIRATQENEKTVFKKRKDNDTLAPISVTNNEKISGMSMGEIVLQLDKTEPNKIKETRTGVKIRGNIDNLFYLHTTDGDFSIYQNLIKAPALTNTPMLSPVSNAGLSAYNFKTIRLKKRNGRKFYTISFTPVKAGNALIEGEIEVMDSLWVITEARYSFPNYLLEQYDYFGVEQVYDTTETALFLLAKQDLTYVSKLGKNVSTGKTLAIFNKYNIDPKFSKKYFSNELAVTTDKAYEQDSSFWEQVRQEPLSTEQLAFIRYSDSVSRAHNTQAYMDSVDKAFNKITLTKIFINGQGFFDRKKERSFFIGPLLTIIDPLPFAGPRLKLDFDYHKVYESRKTEAVWGNLSYGFKNSDFKGEIKVRKLYNTFSRGAYELNLGRNFQSFFSNGSFDQQFDRSGMYERDDIGAQHEIELLNGLFLTNRVEMSFRRDATRYKIVEKDIVIIKKVLEINATKRPQSFPAYQALFNEINLSYTPFQKYLREPREKIILGSKWPTFSVNWRKGIPTLLGSAVDFDYLEYRINQKINLNLFGVLQYNIATGKYINQTKIEIPDNKYIRKKDPFFLLNPTVNFQSMDTSFALLNRFYELHAVHNFNGFIINRIPFMKKVKLQEIVGFGLFKSSDKSLNYMEAFIGLEKNVKLFNDRYKVGAYVVFSEANLFKTNPQFKFSFIKFNRRRASWY